MARKVTYNPSAPTASAGQRRSIAAATIVAAAHTPPTAGQPADSKANQDATHNAISHTTNSHTRVIQWPGSRRARGANVKKLSARTATPSARPSGSPSPPRAKPQAAKYSPAADGSQTHSRRHTAMPVAAAAPTATAA